MAGLSQQGLKFPYLESKGRDLTAKDVDRLLNVYKDVVAKYTSLCKAISHLSTSEREPLLRHLQLQELDSMLETQTTNENEYKYAAKEKMGDDK